MPEQATRGSCLHLLFAVMFMVFRRVLLVIMSIIMFILNVWEWRSVVDLLYLGGLGGCISLAKSRLNREKIFSE